MTPSSDGVAGALRRVLPAERVIVDALRRLALGTDASFYRLVPEVVAVVENEDELRAVLKVAHAQRRPLTFRAAGTSLSGQAITDGILVLPGEGFAHCEIGPGAARVRVGPSVIGGQLNARLAPHGRKLGPDPASIGAARIGGIAANNASGMCCGTEQNSYRTVAGMRIVLADGAVVDTEDAASVHAFRGSHAALLGELAELGAATRADEALAARIRRKFRIKNTTGYSLNALVDFEDPIDILVHLMIGSEGTLGFIASITYDTVADDPYKASALVFFPDIEDACRATAALKPRPVAAVELMDRAALRSVENVPGLPAAMRELPEGAAALLVEVRGATAAALALRRAEAEQALAGIPVVAPVAFTSDAALTAAYWKARKGTLPAVGAVRRTGTTVIIEDVAFPIESLAAATRELQALFVRHGYADAILFGHALEGNLHFVFTQDFGDPAEVARYAALMDDVCTLVVDRYDGSLKAEHGTGRNMAPFVEREWGAQATALMWRLKRLLDPAGLLNPGVVLNEDPQAHLKNLKALPAADALVDRCMECGFCEPMCPSAGLTFTPRQRITSWRELSRQAAAGEPAPEAQRSFAYFGLDTCAGCGLCSTACPVGIDTGALTKALRGRRAGALAHGIAGAVASNFGLVSKAARAGMAVAHAGAAVVGGERLKRLSGGAWKATMPVAGRGVPAPAGAGGTPVVYFPTCAGRMFGGQTRGEPTLPEVVNTVMARAGYAPRHPERCDSLCCGLALASKGLNEEADRMADALAAAMQAAADDGRGGWLPVVMDASSCTARMKKHLAARGSPLVLHDFHEFAHDALLPRLTLKPLPGPVALHANCAVRRTGMQAKLEALAGACAQQVLQPEGVGCCGFAGDRGFVVPELNNHALRSLAPALPAACTQGYSSNLTCEIGLTEASGRPYRSVAYLLEAASR